MVRLFQSCEGKQIGQHGRKRYRACRYLAETRRYGGYERARHGLVTVASCRRVVHDCRTCHKKVLDGSIGVVRFLQDCFVQKEVLRLFAFSEHLL